MKNILLGTITTVVTVCILTAILYAGRDLVIQSVRPYLLDYALTQIPKEKLDNLYREAVMNTGFFWDTVPDPEVARIGKQGVTAVSKKAHIMFNNAGMRSHYPYTTKPPGVFRIVCLGDSFVFGTGGKEEDRFCDQIEQFYQNNEILVDGKTVETYAIGLGSWTAVQEATYFSSRISEYNPDVIIMLTVANDITDISGVTGGGTTTLGFSPEHRDWGSGVFHNQAGRPLGIRGYTILGTNLSLEGRQRWEKAMSRIGILANRQKANNGKILLSVLDMHGPYFTELYKHYYVKKGITAPAIVTSYFPGEKTQLEHDSHPTRFGHSILASHYINALDSLGWVSVPTSELPRLHDDLTLDWINGRNEEKFQKLRRHHLERLLLEIDFEKLESGNTYGFLGGLFPEEQNSGIKQALVVTWASIRAGFVLQQPGVKESYYLNLSLSIPPIPELFPFKLDIRINGQNAEPFEVMAPNSSGIYEIRREVPETEETNPVAEILLTTTSYFSGITDHRMKSYQLIKAALD